MARFNISVRPYGSATRPHLKWVLDVRQANGKRERFFFKTKAEADKEAQIKRRETENIGIRALNISDRLRLEALDAEETLKPYGVSISQVVAEYVKRMQTRTIGIADLAENFIESRVKNGSGGRHLVSLRCLFKRFVGAFEGQPVNEITPEAIESWLDGLNVSAITVNSYRTLLHSLFAYGVKKRVCPENPIAFIDRRAVRSDKVGILTPGQLQKLLAVSYGDVLATVAIGAFAGIRPEEIARLTWEEIDLDEGLIDIPSSKSKTARQRYVKILPVLASWLRPLKASGKIQQSNFRRRFDDAKRAAGFRGRSLPSEEVAGASGLVEWPQDALRHSYASYHIALNENADALALQLGHESTSLIFSNYRHRVKKADAERYFGLARRTNPYTENGHTIYVLKQFPPLKKGELPPEKAASLPQARVSDRIRGEGNSGANEARGWEEPGDEMGPGRPY